MNAIIMNDGVNCHGRASIRSIKKKENQYDDDDDENENVSEML